MKERVFYVINLDKQRIGVLSLFLFALFFSFFFLGVSVGKGRLESAPTPNTASLQQTNTEETSSPANKEESIPAPMSSSDPNTKPSKSKETVALGSGMEVPMADVGNVTNPYYAETSTAKDEEDEKKAQVVDLNKPTVLPKKTAAKHTELAFKNQAPVKTKATKKETVVVPAPGKQLYTLQLGAFGTRDGAESFLAKVTSHSKSKLSSKPFIVYKNGYFVVQMGKSSDKEQLKKQLSKLSAEVKTKAIVVSFIPLARS